MSTRPVKKIAVKTKTKKAAVADLLVRVLDIL